ncbi:MAG: hypothetical protein HUU10_07610 [Bacteroidetes bacterium]|nr:hypothetical protein [Bacteroidota bacterium]
MRLRSIPVIRIALFICISSASGLLAQPVATPPPATPLSGLDISMQWFLGYVAGTDKQSAKDEFLLKRGYVDIRKKIDDTFSGKITTDITVDKEGDGKGDVEVRLKYLYLKMNLESMALFHKPYLEFGMVHTPWIDFEQSINRYRVQGTMFMERANVVGSADYGIVLMSMLGGEMDEEYQRTVQSSNAGRWGSFSVGIFNGGGYHALEENANKTVQGRLSLRPVPDYVPGFQVSVHGASGRGNTESAPDWHYLSGFLSWESAWLTLTAEQFSGKGTYGGEVVETGRPKDAVPMIGYSVFGDVKLWETGLSVFGRHDHVEKSGTLVNEESNRMITGLAWTFKKGSKMILDVDLLNHSKGAAKESRLAELVIELRY